MRPDAYLVDSNILIRWVKPDDRDYPLVKAAIDKLITQGKTLCYTSQNLAEFWNACTRPSSQNGFGLSVEETDLRATVIEGALELLPESLVVHREWRRLIVAHKVAGAKVHDARLAAAMHVHGVERILIFNEGDFARYADIETWHPKALLARLP
jgi:predicted nucleic acid-binding protein